MNNGNQAEREFATKNLSALRKKEKEISSAIASVGVASRPSEAVSISEIEEAIGSLDKRIQNANADEIMGFQKSKMAFEAKKKAFERGIEIPEIENEISEIKKLTSREFKIKIRDMGFDELSEKIKEIDGQLNDLDNPPTAGQKKALEDIKGTYEDWRRQCVMSFSTVQEAWGNVEGIGGGIESLTSALTDNSNAWQKTTAIINGFISIYNGIASVIAIMETIGIVSQKNKIAKEAEAVATVSATTAQGVQTVAQEAAAAAAIPVIAANKATTASYVELAAAEYMAAHASIPFAGFGIAAGFSAAAQALVTSIGLMPFANGGIVSGPTMALVGEYAGARNNPEVIAPLNKLREMIPDGGASPVVLDHDIRIEGSTLVIALRNATQSGARTGRRSGII